MDHMYGVYLARQATHCGCSREKRNSMWYIHAMKEMSPVFRTGMTSNCSQTLDFSENLRFFAVTPAAKPTGSRQFWQMNDVGFINPYLPLQNQLSDLSVSPPPPPPPPRNRDAVAVFSADFGLLRSTGGRECIYDILQAKRKSMVSLYYYTWNCCILVQFSHNRICSVFGPH